MGLRGCGKTTLGRALAFNLSMPFVDLDDETPNVLNCRNVAQAWDLHGQEAFRKAELVALSRVLGKRSRVVALGGGTPTAPHVPDLIRHERESKRIVVFYLRASVLTLRSRLRETDANRPSITGADPLEEIDAVFAARDPLYNSLADRVLDMDMWDVNESLAALQHEAMNFVPST